MQSQGFPNSSNLVFKAVRETGVEQAAECAVSVAWTWEASWLKSTIYRVTW